ncbi:probable ATP-dependent RNA helicase DDX10 [Schistocerca serialis cubense]|uniref:probable ATP-dependent RNA helicase DDX10 n=1 Tax=Schistocerca serialis cubense TaxID=2023355 RepID=UPI00214E7D5D|nr:probable ATP-dependent RNA helicase DDX10 [Schistocerca serialis cubense]
MSGTIKKFNKTKNRRKIKLYKKKKGVAKTEDQEIQEIQSAYSDIDSSKINSFNDFPLSHRTKKGLRDTGYVTPTEIQRESIGPALRGLDILGAAKTGSGKTVAFLVPVLESLFCHQWTRLDGLGALIITPTRELALQIFETLRKVGRYHDFSAGLIIGGKDLHFEKKRMEQVNIIVGTPGRLLQHMDENPLFTCHNLQILVLDEADRCLDLGFEKTMNSIIENLPPKRQTLLFSATQTKSVRDLARLSLKDPCYVSVVEKAQHSTPEQLRQSYTVVELHDKMAVLWSFVRSHLKHKILVFLASCKQVKYHYEILCKLRPGISVLALYGSLHQLRRMDIYRSFCAKKHAVMIATDLAARGLDFPAVDWVVQLDCPEDAHTYIHRAGRTARYQAGGESVLVLLPSEEKAMLQRLEAARIPPLQSIKINPNKLQSPQRKLEALLAQDPALKESAQRAFVAYLKSVFLMADKAVFNIETLDTDAYAKSLGLAIPPRIRFLQKYQKAQRQKQLHVLEASGRDRVVIPSHSVDAPVEDDSVAASSEHDETDDSSSESDHDRNGAAGDMHWTLGGASDDNDDSDFGGILHVKQRDHALQGDVVPDDENNFMDESSAMNKKKKAKALTKAAIAKKVLKKKIIANKKTVFDEDGQAVVDATREKVTEVARQYEAEGEGGGIDLERAREVLREEDRVDKQRFRERVRMKHREEKRKLKKAKMKEMKEAEDQEVEKDTQDDTYASESGSESESSDGPDLSWLPDPDKVYGNRGDDENEEEDRSAESSSEDTEPDSEPHPQQQRRSKTTVGKRKMSLESNNGNVKKVKKANHLPESLEDAEYLALQFLRS